MSPFSRRLKTQEGITLGVEKGIKGMWEGTQEAWLVGQCLWGLLLEHLSSQLILEREDGDLLLSDGKNFLSLQESGRSPVVPGTVACEAGDGDLRN
jgi:hypothetical protein